MSLSSISLLDPDPAKLSIDPTAKTISYFCKQRPILINARIISELKAISKKNGSANVRVCLHDGPDSDHHDMVILECSKRYYRPHRHTYKGDTFHVMEGEMGIFSFNESGEVIDAVILSVGDVYRVEVGMYHAVLPLGDQTIYHENKPGPFLGDKDSLYPEWAPTGEDQSVVDDYLSNLKLKLMEQTKY